MEKRSSDLEGQIGFIRQLEQEIDGLRQAHGTEKSGRYAALGEVFADVVERASDRLQEGMNLKASLRSLFAADPLPSEVEAVLLDNAQSAVEARSDGDAESLVATCQDHWESLIPRVQERLGFTPKSFDTETEGFIGARERFRRRLSRASRQAIVKLKLRSVLDHLLARRRRVLKFLSGSALVLFILAGVTGVMDLPYLPLAALFGGIVLSVLTVIKIFKDKKSITSIFEERAFAARRDFVSHLGEDYRDGVRQFFTEYGGMLEHVRREVGKSKKLMKPRLEQWNSLFLRLKAIEQEL